MTPILGFIVMDDDKWRSFIGATVVRTYVFSTQEAASLAIERLRDAYAAASLKYANPHVAAVDFEVEPVWQRLDEESDVYWIEAADVRLDGDGVLRATLVEVGGTK